VFLAIFPPTKMSKEFVLNTLCQLLFKTLDFIPDVTNFQLTITAAEEMTKKVNISTDLEKDHYS